MLRIKLKINSDKFVFLWPGQKQCCSFWVTKKTDIFLFRIFLWSIVLWSKRKVFANFQKKYSFFRSMWFFESANFDETADLLEFNPQKSIPNRQQCVHFQKSSKVLNHSILLYNCFCRGEKCPKFLFTIFFGLKRSSRWLFKIPFSQNHREQVAFH